MWALSSARRRIFTINYFLKNEVILTMNNTPNPSHILEVGFGFWSSKVLLTAVKLEVFTTLADRAMTGEELAAKIGLHSRGIYDFFDTLVALGFLDRDGNGASGLYRNTPDTATFLDQNQPGYIGGILEMANDRLFKFWSDLETALQTGKPQNEIKHTQKSVFEKLYADPDRLEQFIDAMTGISRGNFQVFATKFYLGAALLRREGESHRIKAEAGGIVEQRA
jgi:hypothetical protein